MPSPRRSVVVPLLLAGGLLLSAAPADAAQLRAAQGVTGLPTGYLPTDPPTTRFPVFSQALGDINGDRASDWGLMVSYSEAESPDTLSLDLHAIFSRPGGRNIDLAKSDPLIRTFDLLASRMGLQKAGDVNGDGIDDVIVGVLLPDQTPLSAVVFGGPSITKVRLDQPGAKGFPITGVGTVRGIGDVNGDRKADLLTYSLGESDEDVAAIVFGSSSTTKVNGIAPGARGVQLSNSGGEPTNSAASVSYGDLNGDRIGDVALGRQSRANILYGARIWPRTIDSANPGARGRTVEGAARLLPGAPDVTGDGRGDLLAVKPDFGSEGPVHVVPGAATTAPITLGEGTLPVDGTEGTLVESYDPTTVAPAGDQNGDGKQDLVVLHTPSDGGWPPETTVRLVPGRATGSLTSTEADELPVPPTRDLTAVGDVDADGSPDTFATLNWVSGGTPLYGVLIGRGKDIFPPQWLIKPQVEPAAFTPGPAATEVLGFTSDARVSVELVIRKASGQLVGAIKLPLATGGIQQEWDGQLNGKPLPVGDYKTTVTATDAAGNRGPSETVAFTILP